MKNSRIYTEQAYGLTCVFLENDQVRLCVLPEKGSDLYSFEYKPLGMDVLMKTPEGLSGMKGRNLYEKPLSGYADAYPGGWQELLPNMIDLEGFEPPMGGCESATVPWDWAIQEETPQRVALRLWVRLSLTPFFVEKTIVLEADAYSFLMTERVVNMGLQTARFTWTQHSAFGGKLIEGEAEVLLPRCEGFNFQAFMKNRGQPLESFIEPLEAMTLPDGGKLNLLEVRPKGDGPDVFFTLRNVAEASAAICNHTYGVALRLEWDAAAYPHMGYWTRHDHIHTVALEPLRSYLLTREDSLRHGEHLTLEPGESLTSWVRCGAYPL